MSQDKYDWLKRTSTFSRVMNPELHTKPNLMVGAIGTGVFVFPVGSMYIQRQAMLQTPKVERVMKENLS